MRPERRLLLVVLTWILCLANSSGQDFTIKKKKLTVLVEQNSECRQEVSVSGSLLSGRKLCVDYPQAAAQRLRMKVGTPVELEALWTFSGKNDSQGPIAVGAVSAIAAERFASNPRTSVAGTATTSPLQPQDRHIQNDLGATQRTQVQTTVVSAGLPQISNEHRK
jgi:hypothetical protein